MDITTTPKTTATHRSARRLLAAVVAPVVGAVALGLGGAPAGAAPPAAPQIVSAAGYDVAGPTSHHRLLWSPGADGGQEVDAWKVERWNADHSQMIASYNVPADDPDVTIQGLPDSTTFTFRVRAQNADGLGAWSGFATSKATVGKTHSMPFLSENAFLKRQLQDFGQPETLGFWPAFVKDADTAGEFIDDLATASNRANRFKVARLYFAYFDRAPEPGGLSYWEARLTSGQSTLTHVSASFANSQEFKTVYGNTTNAQFVNLVYQNVLFRSPDPTGLAFWVDQLDQGKTTRGKLMIGFSESAEGKALRAEDTVIADLFATILRTTAKDADLDEYRPYLTEGGTAGSLGLALLADSGYPIVAA